MQLSSQFPLTIDGQLNFLLHEMAEVFPEKIYVVAQSYREADKFCRYIGRRFYFMSEWRSFQGLDNIHVVFLGDLVGVDTHSISDFLRTRKDISVHHVSQWRTQ